MKNLSIKPFEDIDNDTWDQNVKEFQGTIYHTKWFIEYMLLLNKKNNIQNHSFALLQSDKIVALVPLFIETINDQNQFSIGEELIPSFICDRLISQSQKLKLFIFIDDHISKLSFDHKCSLSRFHISPLIQSYNNEINYFKLYDYEENILHPDWYVFKCDFAYVLDLSFDIQNIYSNIRKRFKSYINKTTEKTTLQILDVDNLNSDLYDDYIKFYYSIKGKRRSIEAFQKDFEAIKDGLEVIFICKFEDKIISAIAIHKFNNMARYNSALVSNIEKLYPNHFLIWESIKYLKERNCNFYEIGEQVIENKYHQPTKKEKDLSNFKAAWGAKLVPWYKAQKEYL